MNVPNDNGINATRVETAAVVLRRGNLLDHGSADKGPRFAQSAHELLHTWPQATAASTSRVSGIRTMYDVVPVCTIRSNGGRPLGG